MKFDLFEETTRKPVGRIEFHNGVPVPHGFDSADLSLVYHWLADQNSVWIPTRIVNVDFANEEHQLHVMSTIRVIGFEAATAQ